MNKKTAIFLGTTLLLASACGNKKQEQTQEKQNVVPEQIEIRKSTLKIPVTAEFFSITNLGSINIDFKEGPYSIVAEGDSMLIRQIETEFDSGVLTVNMPSERNDGVNRFNSQATTTLHIQCPELRIMAICGSGNFTSNSKINSSNLEIGGMGLGEIHFDSISCEEFKYQSNVETIAEFKSVNCKNASVFVYGTSNSTFDIKASGISLIDVGGNAVLNATVASKVIEMATSGLANATVDVDCEAVKLTSQNQSVVNISGKAKENYLRNFHTSTINNHLK
jgi:hypothetical protein